MATESNLLNECVEANYIADNRRNLHSDQWSVDRSAIITLIGVGATGKSLVDGLLALLASGPPVRGRSGFS